MARLSNASLTSPPNGKPFDQFSGELGRLLARLQQTVLHPEPARERRLRTNAFERAKLGSNLEYARNSLTKLEQDAMGILGPGRRAEVQADLNSKRELLDQLLDRLQDLNKMAADDNDDSDDDTSEGEDILADIIPTPSESQASTAEDHNSSPATTTEPPAPAAIPSATPSHVDAEPESRAQPLPTQTTSSLRARNNTEAAAVMSAPPAPSQATQQDRPAYATARAALFANRQRPGTTGATPETSTATAEAILDQQAAEREDLADKVFKMAQAMKKQQQSIYDSLETEKDVLSRATEGMERTGRGMEVARGRMGLLQKMSEGKGWWGRVMLYAWVYGLMVALLVLVFVLPKLRLS